ncbi:MAG: peptidylprolyl isomerase [Christensenellales bacterium]
MLKKTLALALAALLALGSLAALAETAAAPLVTDDPALATLNGSPILKSEVDAVIPQLQDYMSDASDYQYAVEFLVRQRVLDQKIKDMGFDQFTAEEQDAFQKEAQAQWEEGIESYVTYYLSEDTEAARAELRTQAEAFYTQQGFDLALLTANVSRRAAIDRMTSYLVGGYQPTQEEIDATFQQYGASYQQNYENNVTAYEYNTIYGQQPSWYTPAGYRGIIHILLQPDAAVLDAYNQLASAFEEQQNLVDADPAVTTAPEATADPAALPTATPVPVTQEQVDKARQAVLDAVKADTDAIYASLSSGETFEALIAKYGKDPGMQDEATLKDGYLVHKESVVWDPAFTAGAFSGKMAAVGDVSDPIVSSHGVHILKYLRDVPSGLIMTDAIGAEIADYLTSVKESEAYAAAYAGWETEVTIEYDQEAITRVTDAAKALQATQEESDPTLEALPLATDAPAEATAAPNP